MLPWLLILALVGVFALTNVFSLDTSSTKDISYSRFMEEVRDGNVKKVEFDPSNGEITGELGDLDRRDEGLRAPRGRRTTSRRETSRCSRSRASISMYQRRGSNFFLDLIPLLLPAVLIIGFFVWMSRRAQGQMGAVMNIGRSRAKVYNTEKPKTTFDDVAGYGPVKEEIAEVVDFLKYPQKFKEIGARIPKGVLLVGPPGTGKTLIARAVAGEAGVPFVSVTGSDFMEMFVGVGAARVRDLFQTARKQAPAIIFVDEIDSIGRKRGAGLGGGHDEREQTLNQMLAEMDGFEATEGIVMMAATNRPDVLDPALLRPGRFDRQIIVPLPTQEERVEILEVHFRDKKIGDDVNVDVVARGTPGMAGADLANLVNEAALFAVRRGIEEVHGEDFDAARDRVLMGLKRDVDGDQRRGEGGHRVPRGRSRGARVRARARRPGAQGHDPAHAAWRSASPSSCPTRSATSTSASTSPTRSSSRSADASPRSSSSATCPPARRTTSCGITEMARKMVREWGMSDRIGPMAWGSQGAVFLGEDLVHTRDYSDETARVIDEEVERILRDEESARRASVLREHRRRARRRRPSAARARDARRRARSARSSTTRWAARSAATARSGAPTARSSRCGRRATTARRRRRKPASTTKRASRSRAAC